MIIDCASCVGRPTECGDCVISVVLGPHPAGIDLDADERTAVAALAGSGLVPPLRLMPIPGERAPSRESPGGARRPGTVGLTGTDSARPRREPESRTGNATRWSRRPRAG